jgi:uncharacterized SAM-binding protein YcdF (DUF218 family)
MMRSSARSRCRTLPRNECRRRRHIRRLVTSVYLLLIAAVIGGLPVYVQPQIDRLRHADAILILGGEGKSRYPLGLDLGLKGWAPTVVVSNPMAPEHPVLTDYCATRHPGLDLRCFVPDPPTTKGEGRELRRLAAQYGWRTVIVVTFRPHISRARFILEQCFDGDLVMVASPARISIARWAFAYAYQTGGYLRAALQPGC